MRTIRNFTKNPLTIAVLLLAFLNLSCNQDDFVESYVDNSISNKYSGEEIFKGVFFFQNDNIVSNISFLSDYSDRIMSLEQNSEIEKSLKEMSQISVNYINNNYPNFFQELQTAVYSNNLYEIESMFNKSVMILEQSLLSDSKYHDAMKLGKVVSEDTQLISEIQKLDLSTDVGVLELRNILASSDYGDPENAGDAVFFAGVLAVAYIAAAAVSFVVAAYSVVTKAAYWDPTSNAKNNTVNQEMAISEISGYFNNN